MKSKTHSFIAKMQKEFYSDKKANLKVGEVAINCDFAENYSFILQDEVQFHHWNNSQTTIHPFIIYYNGKYGTMKHVFISECLKHTTVAFNIFQILLISDLKEFIPNLNKNSTFRMAYQLSTKTDKISVTSVYLKRFWT